jgi:hypothetical protein
MEGGEVVVRGEGPGANKCSYCSFGWDNWDCGLYCIYQKN